MSLLSIRIFELKEQLSMKTRYNIEQIDSKEYY